MDSVKQKAVFFSHDTRMPLAVGLERHRFNSAQEDKLIELLERMDRSADVIPITSEEMVRLDADGRIGAGFRLNTWAFSQICSAVCPGLYNMLVELNATGTPEAKAASVSIINQLVRLNFRLKLVNQLFLVDRASQTVEAVVSPDYKLLPNIALYQRFRTMVEGLPFETAFYEAILHGRWVIIRFYRKDALFTHEGTRYFGGYHVSNQEGGRASVHAGLALICERERLSMLTPFSRGDVARHVGRKFEGRIASLLGHLAGQEHQVEVLQAGVAALHEQTLGLGNKDERLDAARKRELARRLNVKSHVGVPVPLIKRAIQNAIHQPFGASQPKSRLAINRQDLLTRTVWDLVVAVCREAKKQSIATREALEQLALAILMGRVKTGIKPAEV